MRETISTAHLARQAVPQAPLVLASSRTDPAAIAEIEAGKRPRLDYLVIAQALGAEVLDTGVADALPTWRRYLERALSSDLRQAQTAWQHGAGAAAWLSTSEKVGLPLALRVMKRRNCSDIGRLPHIMIAHNLNTARKRILDRLTGVLCNGFSAIICLSETQEAFLRDVVNLPERRVRRVYDSIDETFFRSGPSDPSDGEYVLAVGRENRDYRTLVEAARSLSLPVTIVASSLWSSRALGLDMHDLPSNVTVRQDYLSYVELRTLYEKARLVVTPLHPCDYAAGVNGALEAMAMAKASIVTRTRGLAEYVQDGRTTCLVPPHNAMALAGAIRTLWDDASSRRALGSAARTRIEREMSLDGYAAQVAGIVNEFILEESRP